MIEAFWLPYFCVAAWIQLQGYLQHGFQRECSKLGSGAAKNRCLLPFARVSTTDSAEVNCYAWGDPSQLPCFLSAAAS